MTPDQLRRVAAVAEQRRELEAAIGKIDLINEAHALRIKELELANELGPGWGVHSRGLYFQVPNDFPATGVGADDCPNSRAGDWGRLS